MEWILLNWFEILKNTGLAQSQRQGFRLDDKDEDYVLEEENDCLEKLIAFFKKTCEDLKMRPVDLSGIELGYPDIEYQGDFVGNESASSLLVYEESPLADDQFCTILEEFKKFVNTFILNFSKETAKNEFSKIYKNNGLGFKISRYHLISENKTFLRFAVKKLVRRERETIDLVLRFKISERSLQLLMGGESNNEDTQKAAGAVTSSTPGIHRVRYSPKKKKEEDE